MPRCCREQPLVAGPSAFDRKPTTRAPRHQSQSHPKRSWLNLATVRAPRKYSRRPNPCAGRASRGPVASSIDTDLPFGPIVLCAFYHFVGDRDGELATRDNVAAIMNAGPDA